MSYLFFYTDGIFPSRGILIELSLLEKDPKHYHEMQLMLTYGSENPTGATRRGSDFENSSSASRRGSDFELVPQNLEDSLVRIINEWSEVIANDSPTYDEDTSHQLERWERAPIFYD